MRLIDTHLHLVDRTRLSYPWLKDVPALDRDHGYARWQAEAVGLGITDALHMEVDVAESDQERETDVVEALAAEPDSLLRGAIASCRPEDEAFPAVLERTLARPFVRGFRRVLHVVPDAVSEGAVFRRNVARLAGTGLTFDLCVRPDQLDRAVALVDAAPDVAFVIDHCGAPAVAEGALEPWRTGMAELARRPNLTAKISGVVAYAGPDWTVETLRPFVETTIRLFGWDRVVWGSDWPVCTLTADLTRWVEATREITRGCSDDEREKLGFRNAERVYRV